MGYLVVMEGKEAQHDEANHPRTYSVNYTVAVDMLIDDADTGETTPRIFAYYLSVLKESRIMSSKTVNKGKTACQSDFARCRLRRS